MRRDKASAVGQNDVHQAATDALPGCRHVPHFLKKNELLACLKSVLYSLYLYVKTETDVHTEALLSFCLFCSFFLS
jgi:hypothetical protein